MTREKFLENFYKIYEKNNENIFISSVPYPLIMAKNKNIAVGMGITPDTLMGIRFCEEKKVFIRQTGDELMYECEAEKLASYDGEDWSREIFLLLARFIKKTDMCGMQILFHCDCNDEFKNYFLAAAVGFCKCFLPKKNIAEILEYIMPKKMDFADKITLLCPKNTCFFETGEELSGYSFEDEYKIIIAKTKKHMKKDSRAEEDKNFEKPSGFKGLSEFIKKGAEESLKSCKNSEYTAMLYNEAKKYAEFVGIYKDCGVYAFIRDAEVDEFVRKTGEEYEKKAGSKPEFYICNSSQASFEKM